MVGRSRIESLVSCFVKVAHPQEAHAVFYSASSFFFILSAYFVIIPLRDEGAISLGLANLPELFVGSLFLTLLAAPLSTLVFSLPNLSRPKALVLILRFFSLSLAVFFILWVFSSPGYSLSTFKGFVMKSSTIKDELKIEVDKSTQASSSGWGDHDWFYISVRIGLFLWVALLNLITISSTWARVIDVMDSESGSRLFGFIGAGATLGQLFGSLFATVMAWMGPYLLLFSSLLMELAAQSSKRINMDTSYTSEELSPIRKADSVEQTAPADEQTAPAARGFSVNFTSLTNPKKWAIFDGLRLILSSTYLLQVSLFLWFSAAVSSFFYFQAMELHRWKMEEEARLEEARQAEEAALAIAEQEKAKCRAAMEAAEAAQRLAKMEAQKRISAEMKALKEAEEKKKYMSTLAHNDTRYRKYSIDEIEAATEFFNQSRKIGEGGYGPVYKCYLDHTPVAVKVLRPDAAQGRSQFQQEVEVLSCIRHPNMVLLLGACPEYGCLVYEYMANGSLEDRLFRQGNSPVLSWQQRFRIAAEIATGLLFLHQSKPEPLVHRDLKPGNILLDRNYVSKISDVGLARLVPPSVADTVTQYRMTSTAGTFCYIDPEYQQTGMLGIKSDIYSLGIMLLQIITARPPMGLTHHVERALERGTISDILDPEVTDWPLEEAEAFARISLKCAELRRKDRPDLGRDVLPLLERLRQLAEDSLPNIDMIYNMGMGGGRSSASSNSSMSTRTQDQIASHVSNE